MGTWARRSLLTLIFETAFVFKMVGKKQRTQHKRSKDKGIEIIGLLANKQQYNHSYDNGDGVPEGCHQNYDGDFSSVHWSEF